MSFNPKKEKQKDKKPINQSSFFNRYLWKESRMLFTKSSFKL